ncbi:unnamed protein product, partial [Mesorhabditis spiculigera]
MELLLMIYEHLAHVEGFLEVTEREGMGVIVDDAVRGRFLDVSEEEQRLLKLRLTAWIRAVGVEAMRIADRLVEGISDVPERIAVADPDPADAGNSGDYTRPPLDRLQQGDWPPAYPQRVRHALPDDLTAVYQRLNLINTRMTDHLSRLGRVTEHHGAYDIGTPQTLTTSATANVLSSFMELSQRAAHRLSHLYHLLSELNVNFADPLPRRLQPVLAPSRRRPAPEGEIVLQIYLPPPNMDQTLQLTNYADVCIVPHEGHALQRPVVHRPTHGSAAGSFLMGAPMGLDPNAATDGPWFHLVAGPEAAQIQPAMAASNANNQNINTAPPRPRMVMRGGYPSRARGIPRLRGQSLTRRIASVLSRANRARVSASTNTAQSVFDPFGLRAGLLTSGTAAPFEDETQQATARTETAEQTGDTSTASTSFDSDRHRVRIPRNLFIERGHADRNTDPLLPCSSVHTCGAEDFQHIDSLVAELGTSLEPINDPAPPMEALAQSTEIMRTGNSRLYAENDEQLSAFLNTLLRSVIGLLDEADRTHRLSAGRTQIGAVIEAQVVFQAPAQQPSQAQNAPSNGNPINFEGMTENARNMIQRLFTATTNRSNVPIGQLFPDTSTDAAGEGTSLMAIMNRLIADYMSMPDLLALFSRNLEPIVRLRRQFRQFITVNYLDDNSRPTREDIDAAAGRMAVSPELIISILDRGGGQHTFEELDVQWDVAETAVRVERYALRDLLTILFDQTVTDTQFAERGTNRTERYLREMMALGDAAVGRPRGYQDLIGTYLQSEGLALLGEGNQSNITSILNVAFEHLQRLTTQDSRSTLRTPDMRPALVQHFTGSAPKKMRHADNQSQDSGPSTSTANMPPPSANTTAASPSAMDVSEPPRAGTWETNVPLSWLATIRHDIARMTITPRESPARPPRSQTFLTMLGRGAKNQGGSGEPSVPPESPRRMEE